MPHLGPFELTHPLEEGGLATVWAAVHTATRLPVAVKVLDPETDHQVRARALRDELRAMAVLDHGNIIQVLDHGLVPAGVTEFAEGLPWIALELAENGSLGQLHEPQPWSVIRGWLLQLLSALGHAHAHGVLHRDVKPSNVLLDGKRRTKLCDFGLASALDPDDGVAQAGGTPRYMAPEQFLEDVVRQGPWTDLYGVGCLAWRLVTGQPPYVDKGYDALRAAHLYRELPPLQPWTRIPEDLELWLQLLLAKDPRARFGTAPDAAYHLLDLGPPVLDALPDDLSDFLMDDGTSERDPDLVEILGTPVGDPLGEPYPVPLRPSPPPFPPLAMGLVRPHRPKLSAAGLSLLPLRPLSLAGRKAEQKALWSLLGDVHETGEPRLVVLAGDPGTGVSRLATWLVEEARESGAGGAVRAVHNPFAGPYDGLAGMLRRHFRCGSNRARNAQKVERALRRRGETNPHYWEALTDWLSIDGGNPPMAERYHLLADHLERLTEARPYVLVVEDAQWAADALAFVETMLDGSLSVLLVLTLEEVILAERPVERLQIEGLLQHERASRIDVGPLDEAGRAEFSAALPVPDVAVAQDLIGRADGMPLFAMHIVRDWVASGTLFAGTEGPALRLDAVQSLPKELDDLWVMRVNRLLSDRHGDDRVALGVACVLGRVVVYKEWNLACELAGTTADPTLVEALIDAGLARRTRRGDPAWSFVHAALRDALLDWYEGSGRGMALNLACARMLEQRAGAPDRLGRHLVQAEEWDAALSPLLVGARAAFDRGEYHRAVALLDEAETSWKHAPDRMEAMLELLSVRSAVAHRRGESPEAERLAKRALDLAESERLVTYQVSSRSLLALTALAQGRLEDALGLAKQAKALADAGHDSALMASTALGLGDVLLRGGRLDAAVEPLTRAATLGRSLARPQTAILALLHLADVEKSKRRYGAALRQVEEVRALAEAAQSNSAIATCDLAQAEIYRYSGQLDESKRSYQRAEQRMSAIGEAGAHVARVGLGLVCALQGDLDEARDSLEEGLTVALRHGHSAAEIYARCAMSVWAALQPDGALFKDVLTTLLKRVEELGYVEPDFPEVLELGAHAVLESGRPSRAQRLRDAAAVLWERLGWRDRSDPLRNLIAPPRR